MKKRMRLLALALTGVMTVSCFTGCGSKGGEEGGQSATDIEISYWNSGLGTEWLDNVIAAFEDKHPEYNVYYNETASMTAVSAAYGLEDTDTVDLYMGLKQYDMRYLEPLDDVLNATAEGDSKTIKEKFDESYLALEEYDGKYYTLTYGGGVLGFVYNKDLFEQAGIKQLPRTTDELALVCGTLSDNGIKPLCHYKTSGYYSYMSEAWLCQYEGMDNYINFYANPTKESMTKQDGRYEVLKVYEKFLKPDSVLQGSNSESHVSMQTKFLEGQCAMMVNGSWLANEMKNIGKVDNFAMMKQPVISSITDKLTTVKSESELRKLISAIDSVDDGSATLDSYKDGDNYDVDGIKVSAADWDYVYEARNTLAANYAGETYYIPTYSNAKEGAKEFLKFVFSDEGYKIFTDTLHILMPLSLSEGEIDTSGWSAFEQNQVEMFTNMKNGITMDIMSKHRLFSDGGATAWANYEYANLFCASSEADRVTADKAWDHIVSTVNDKYDNEWMKNIK